MRAMHLASCMMQDLRNPQSAFVAARLASPVSAQPTERAFSVRGRAPPCSGLALARALTRQWARRGVYSLQDHTCTSHDLCTSNESTSILLEAIAPRPPPQHLILAFPTIDSEMATDVVFYQPVHRYVNKTDRGAASVHTRCRPVCWHSRRLHRLHCKPAATASMSAYVSSTTPCHKHEAFVTAALAVPFLVHRSWQTLCSLLRMWK